MSFGCEVFVFGVPGESGVVSERCSSESGVACVQFWRTPQQLPALNYQVNYQKLLSKLLNELPKTTRFRAELQRKRLPYYLV